jgi:hypothetical protein
MARLSELAGVALPDWSGSHDGAANGHRDRGSQGAEPTLGFEPRTGAGQAGGSASRADGWCGRVPVFAWRDERLGRLWPPRPLPIGMRRIRKI